jgi:hypothetical protein
MSKLLKSCISQLWEVQSSVEMTPADRDQLRSIITSLEALERELEDEHDEARRFERIFQCVEFVSRILVKIFFDPT